MKKFLGLITLFTLMLFTASAMQTVDHSKKASPPDCSVMVSQSIDMTTNTVALLPVEHSTWIIQKKITNSYPIVTQTIEPVYSNILLLATNQTIINNWWRKLVPIPLVATLDRNNKINDYNQSLNVPNNTTNQNIRHV